jgi:tRNA uridine 5-carboxymethylaminomethyl modification enzyme
VFLEKQERTSAATRFLLETRLDPQTRAGRQVYTKLGLMTDDRFTGPATLTGAQLLRRPEVSIEDLIEWVNEALARQGLAPLGGAVADAAAGETQTPFAREEAIRVETGFKYEGYLAQQERQMERMKRAESRHIPEWFDYSKVSGLSREVVEKLTRVRPLTLGQALRIPGITPAAVSLVNVYVEIFQRRQAEVI